MNNIGVLGLQGDYEKHAQMLTGMGVGNTIVRTPEDLVGIRGLIIPGGESTTIGRLLVSFSLMDPIIDLISSGMPVFGTCAGLIVLARQVQEKNQFRMGLLDVDVLRNGYGRQIESFEADIQAETLGDTPMRAVFIRAPIVESLGPSVEVLATHEDLPILIRQGNILACTFHPELTSDTRIHTLFISSISAQQAEPARRLRA